MIDGKCFTNEWQLTKRKELGGCDPVLLEKTIHAFALLDALANRGLNFIFKGGTSLMLRLPRVRRLSIDADILCQETPTKIDTLLAEVSRMSPFTGMVEDERGTHRLPSRRHFKFSYKPLNAMNPAPFVLLDVVHERNLYPVVEPVPLRTVFVESDSTLMVPTIEGLLGDKLTAFGPNTTGVPLNDRYTMQFMKQIFDIGELFDAANDLAVIRNAYKAIFAAENGYRGRKYTLEQALQDSLETAYTMVQTGLSGIPTTKYHELFDIGRKQLESHLFGVKFRREEMKIAASKAALLSRTLHTSADLKTLRYDETKIPLLKTMVFPANFSSLGKLKAIPEAMWYWSEALRMQ